ncbi:unnamed protein product, partial [marine sediment metagenome]
MEKVHIPKRQRGRQTSEAEDQYVYELQKFAKAILNIDSTLDFKVSSRGWCYILENESGLLKSDFNKVQLKINECRKAGLLPMDICATDEAREFSCIEEVGDENKTPKLMTAKEYAKHVQTDVRT